MADVQLATRSRLMLWRGLDGWRAESAQVDIGPDGVSAAGTQLGLDPLPYRLDYWLDATDDFVTRRLAIEVRGDGWERRLELLHDGGGDWSCDALAAGDADLPRPCGADDETVARLRDARDCDLGHSPLTNAIPILRSGLHEREGAEDLTVAWVSVPDLALLVSPQRYEHVRRVDGGAVVRYVDRGLFPGFTAELELDADGLVRHYPALATWAGG